LKGVNGGGGGVGSKGAEEEKLAPTPEEDVWRGTEYVDWRDEEDEGEWDKGFPAGLKGPVVP